MTAVDASETSTRKYIGRFAPSPTGPLHFGSLVAALASWLDARSHEGSWLLRIEDLDPPREDPSAPDTIKRQLETLGLTWDGDPLYQSTRQDAYDEALNELRNKGMVYVCTCSRKSIRGVYPGNCREKRLEESAKGACAIRLRVPNKIATFNDRISGSHIFDLDNAVGDFIVRRRDGRTAYQLAVAVDDEYQNVTDIIRGDDLLDSTPRQLCIIEALGYQSVRYGHLPVILGADHKKLSKQAHAAPVSIEKPEKTIRDALLCLGQTSPPDTDNVQILLNWAIENWQPDMIPARSTVWTPA